MTVYQLIFWNFDVLIDAVFSELLKEKDLHVVKFVLTGADILQDFGTMGDFQLSPRKQMMKENLFTSGSFWENSKVFTNFLASFLEMRYTSI